MTGRWRTAVLAVLLVGCAKDAQLVDRPDRVWASPRSLDEAAACIIRVLDSRSAALTPRRTHVSRVIEAGQSYEVRASASGAVSSETYFVRLEKAGDGLTRISVFADTAWQNELIKALAPCGRRS